MFLSGFFPEPLALSPGPCLMNIILIGYRGSGKTSVGRELAKLLNRPLFDSDRMVFAKTGRTVREIVEAGGWPAFREAEKSVIGELAALDQAVVHDAGRAGDGMNHQAGCRTGKAPEAVDCDCRCAGIRAGHKAGAAGGRHPAVDDRGDATRPRRCRRHAIARRSNAAAADIGPQATALVCDVAGQDGFHTERMEKPSVKRPVRIDGKAFRNADDEILFSDQVGRSGSALIKE